MLELSSDTGEFPNAVATPSMGERRAADANKDKRRLVDSK
jgi:hypothetical protein